MIFMRIRKDRSIKKDGFKEINEQYIDVALSAIKLITLLSMPIGFIYLLSYTNANDIPLPLSLSELPTLLMSIFGLGSFFAIIFLGFVFLPAAGKLGLLGNNLVGVFDGGKNDKHKYITTIGVPLLGSLICFLVFVFIRSDEWNWLIYSIASLASIIFFIYGIIHNYENKFRLKISGIILYFLLISLYWMMMGLMMFTQVMASSLPAMSDIDFFIQYSLRRYLCYLFYIL